MNKILNKNNIRDIISPFVISLCLTFMLFIYEPIMMYASNIDDFWFDFKLLFSNITFLSIIIFIIFMLCFISLSLLTKYVFKNKKIFNIILIISFILFTFTYIQGNYLIGSLPVLTGEVINYQNFETENIISLLILILLIVIELILIKKFKIKNALKINNYIMIAIFLMLSTSLISILFTPNLFNDKTVVNATTKNINTVSKDKNFFIFVADSIDSREFAKVVKENTKYKDTFYGFTYYPDTTSAYLYTRDSIPFILSNVKNELETEFPVYYNKAFETSKLFKELKNKNYEMNFYEYEIYSNNKVIDDFKNVLIYEGKMDKFVFFKQLTKYILFKYLPYNLKSYSKIETSNFNLCKIEKNDNEYFKWYNDVNYKNIIDNKTLEKQDNKYFQFIHIEGGHVPFDYDEDVNIIENGTYSQKITAVLNIFNSFVERLKQNNSFDNSVIVFLADHGEGENTLRQNPILYIKGFNERHELEHSNKKVAYEDLIEAYSNLLNDKPSSELFTNINDDRERIVLNNYTDNEMIEWIQKGNAWDNNTFEATGRVFNR